MSGSGRYPWVKGAEKQMVVVCFLACVARIDKLEQNTMIIASRKKSY